MRKILVSIMIVAVLVLNGCGAKGGKADENKPVAQVQTEAKSMSAADLRQTALAYKDAIMAKQQDVQQIADKLKGLNVSQLMDQGAKQLKTDMDQLEKSVSALKERFNIYYQQLQEKKGDLSGLELK